MPVFALGLNDARFLATGETLWPRKTAQAETAPLTARPEDAFALRFVYTPADTRWHVGYAAGVTQGVAPGTLGLGTRGALWDFRACDAAALAAWQPHHAQAACAAGSGLHLQPTGPTPQWETAAPLPPAPPGARFARLTVAARYPPLPAPPTPALALQWFRRAPDGTWDATHSLTLPLATDSATHLYWTFMPLAAQAAEPGGLRLDPVTGLTPVDLAWIALDYVP